MGVLGQEGEGVYSVISDYIGGYKDPSGADCRIFDDYGGLEGKLGFQISGGSVTCELRLCS
jgi:hypothetical protein